MTFNYHINGHDRVLPGSPVILLSNSHDEGRYNKPYSGGNWDDYVKGKNEREWNERVNQDNKNSGNSNWGSGNPGSGGGGADGCGMIILVALTLLIAVPSAVSALLSSTAMLFATRALLPSFSKIPFKTAYLAAFWTTLIYLLVAMILAFLQTWLYPTLTGWNEKFSIHSTIKYFYFFKGYTLLSTLTLIKFHLPCILLSA